MQSRKLYHKVLIYAILIVSCLSSCKRQEAGTVKVDGGWIRGIVTDDMTIYKGIPFAAPPVGDLRWKAPQPVKPWKGILAATDFAPSPIQDSDELTISEDCLYLNIWTPAKSPADKLPVMVWIYGGGFSLSAAYLSIAYKSKDFSVRIAATPDTFSIIQKESAKRRTISRSCDDKSIVFPSSRAKRRSSLISSSLLG